MVNYYLFYRMDKGTWHMETRRYGDIYTLLATTTQDTTIYLYGIEELKYFVNFSCINKLRGFPLEN